MNTHTKSKRKGVAATIVGIVLLTYFIGVAILLKRVDAFTVGLFIISVVWIIVSVNIGKMTAAVKMAPRFFRYGIVSIVIVFIASVVLVEGLIISGMNQEPEAGADYVVVLGCQVRGTVPSLALAGRVDVAIEYLKQNEDTDVVACGGQGPGEDISEAEAMKEMLLQSGIEKERIFLESKSTTTLENLKFADELCGLSGKTVVVVSSDYHMFRALALAGKMGYKSVSGLPSKSEWIPVPAYLMREYVGVIGYWLTGKI